MDLVRFYRRGSYISARSASYYHPVNDIYCWPCLALLLFDSLAIPLCSAIMAFLSCLHLPCCWMSRPTITATVDNNNNMELLTCLFYSCWPFGCLFACLSSVAKCLLIGFVQVFSTHCTVSKKRETKREPTGERERVGGGRYCIAHQFLVSLAACCAICNLNCKQIALTLVVDYDIHTFDIIRTRPDELSSRRGLLCSAVHHKQNGRHRTNSVADQKRVHLTFVQSMTDPSWLLWTNTIQSWQCIVPSMAMAQMKTETRKKIRFVFSTRNFCDECGMTVSCIGRI